MHIATFPRLRRPGSRCDKRSGDFRVGELSEGDVHVRRDVELVGEHVPRNMGDDLGDLSLGEPSPSQDVCT